MPPADVRAALERIAPVSDQAWAGLEAYVRHLLHWQKTLNLIAPGTVDSIWERHIRDCWQLVPIVRDVIVVDGSGALLDLGSGAGLPGLVLAVAGIPDVHLVEANHRKAAFLRFAAEQSQAKATVHACRIESLPALNPPTAAVITARALAPLSALLSLAFPFVTGDTLLVFPKGRRWEEEVGAAEQDYRFDLSCTESVTESDAVILRIRSLSRRN
jgi:16S rRNA (guanine527-N7)-methyltransferase